MSLTSLIDEFGGRVACLAMSKDPNAKMTLLFFRPGAKRPSLVAKVPTTDAAARNVEREADHLAEIADRVVGPIVGTVPQVVTMSEHLGRPVLVMTALPGRSMNAMYHTWRHTARPDVVAGDFSAASRWLGELRETTTVGEIDLASALVGLARSIEARFGERPGLADDLDHVRRLKLRLQEYHTVQTMVHGDFWPGNLLMADGSVCGVIDWESASTVGSPLRDVARFVISYSLYLDRHTRPGRSVPGHPELRAGRWGAGVEYAIDGSGWYPELVRGFVGSALEQLGVDRACWRDVLLADLVLVAAEADHPDFAWRHLLLFRRLYREQCR